MKYYFFDSRSLLQVTKLNHFANFSFHISEISYQEFKMLNPSLPRDILLSTFDSIRMRFRDLSLNYKEDNLFYQG